MLKLYTFNVSHFAEKARWTLDYEGIAYEERVLLPGPHQLVTRRIARRTHVPVLEHDGRYVQGSSAIIDYVADRLGGTRLTAVDPTERAKALELEKTLDQALGRGVQQVLIFGAPEGSADSDRSVVVRRSVLGARILCRRFSGGRVRGEAYVQDHRRRRRGQGQTTLRDDIRRARCGACEAAATSAATHRIARTSRWLRCWRPCVACRSIE